MLSSGIAAATFDPVRMLNTFVDMQLTNILRLKEGNLRTVFLHEVITDLGISFETEQLFDSYMRHVRDKYDAMPGFVTRNFVRFVTYFRDAGLSLKGTVIMTPFNSIGFQMNPVERNLRTMSLQPHRRKCYRYEHHGWRIRDFG